MLAAQSSTLRVQNKFPSSVLTYLHKHELVVAAEAAELGMVVVVVEANGMFDPPIQVALVSEMTAEADCRRQSLQT